MTRRAPEGHDSSTGSCLPQRRLASAPPQQRSSRHAALTQKTLLSWNIKQNTVTAGLCSANQHSLSRKVHVLYDNSEDERLRVLHCLIYFFFFYLPLYTNFMGSTANAVATTSSALCLRPLTTISPSIFPTTNTRLSWWGKKAHTGWMNEFWHYLDLTKCPSTQRSHCKFKGSEVFWKLLTDRQPLHDLEVISAWTSAIKTIIINQIDNYLGKAIP